MEVQEPQSTNAVLPDEGTADKTIPKADTLSSRAEFFACLPRAGLQHLLSRPQEDESTAPFLLNFCTLYPDGVSDWQQASLFRVPCHAPDFDSVFAILSKRKKDGSNALGELPVGIAFLSLGEPVRITYANDKLLNILGCDRDSFEREIMPDAMRLIHPEDYAFVRHELLAAVHRNSPVAFRYRAVPLADGNIHYLSVRAVPVARLEGKVPLFLMLVLDTTEQGRVPSINSFSPSIELPSLSSGRPSVLIVDDSGLNREILARILRNEYSILTAENGLTALSLLRQHAKNIAAVLLDIEMPVMDGHEFLEIKARISELGNIPVIVVTGNNDSENELRALRAGAWDFVTKPYKSEIIRFRLKNAILRSQLSAFDKLKYLAEYDTLTGIFNKTKFFAATHEMLMANSSESFAFIRFDINRFNLINSYYGTQEGDALLKYIGNMLARFAILQTKCTYGRIEADVFGVCFPFFEVSQVIGVVERGRACLREYGLNFDIVPTCGVYFVEDHGIPVDRMYDKANLAAKQCKGDYINNFRVYDEEMGRAVEKEQEITNEMNTALDHGQFIPYFQPKFNLWTRSLAGAEALVRWQHPVKNLISPANFIPIFERNGFISKLDYSIWEQTCRLLRSWSEKKQRLYPISVNVSRVDLYSPHLVETICSLTSQYGIPNALLNLEITESAYMDNPEMIKKITGQLQQKGFCIQMDDFGSGYSSFNVLKDISVDVLKIDMRFLSDTASPERGRSIIRSIVSMAQTLGIPTVAEGVEKAEQSEFLRDIGCDYGQGYYFAKPMPASDYEKLLCENC